jgi:hypothetical protein
MEAKNEASQNPQAVVQPRVSTPGGSSVSALVTKSKKAASSLFTLLHAKVRHPKLTVLIVHYTTLVQARLIFILFALRPYRTVNSGSIGVHIRAAPKQSLSTCTSKHARARPWTLSRALRAIKDAPMLESYLITIVDVARFVLGRWPTVRGILSIFVFCVHL